MLLGIVGKTQDLLAKQIGKFLCDLHTTDISNLDWEIPSTLAPVTRDRWLDIRQRVEQKNSSAAFETSNSMGRKFIR